MVFLAEAEVLLHFAWVLLVLLVLLGFRALPPARGLARGQRQPGAQGVRENQQNQKNQQNLRKMQQNLPVLQKNQQNLGFVGFFPEAEVLSFFPSVLLVLLGFRALPQPGDWPEASASLGPRGLGTTLQYYRVPV